MPKSVSAIRRRRRGALPGLGAAPLLALAWPQLAGAVDPSLQAVALGGYAVAATDGGPRRHGWFGGAELAWTPGDWFALRAGYQAADNRGRGSPLLEHQVSIGARYLLDVFEYVPWLEASPLLVQLRPGDADPSWKAGLAVGLGFDWLLDPRWSVGAAIHLHMLADEERFPAWMSVGLRLGYRFPLGDPYAP